MNQKLEQSFDYIEASIDAETNNLRAVRKAAQQLRSGDTVLHECFDLIQHMARLADYTKHLADRIKTLNERLANTMTEARDLTTELNRLVSS